jgi:5-methyltetrahydrofolate--homocysteine methyltransferase
LRIDQHDAPEIQQLLHGKYRGARYSPGYPAMTDISNNQIIADLLEAGKKLGIRLTEGYQFDPTGTTAAVICFHQDADYH